MNSATIRAAAAAVVDEFGPPAKTVLSVAP